MRTSGLLFALKLVLLLGFTSATTTDQRLVIWLVDGLRYDYVSRDQTDLKGFGRIIQEGVYVTHVKPVYPSVSYPNWYSIATGLYGESHGQIANHMYDVERMDIFENAPNPNSSHEHWWNKAEPIWITVEKNAMDAAMYYWDGCQVKIKGFKPSVCEMARTFSTWFSSKNDTTVTLRRTLEWFQESEKHRLAMVYNEGPDYYGHKYGPDSPAVYKSVREVDEMLNIFLSDLQNSTLKGKVNLMIVSDHGMRDVTEAKIIEPEIDPQDAKLIMGSGALMFVYTETEQQTAKIYNRLKEKQLKGLHVYRSDEIPTSFHITRFDVTPQILLEADAGFFLLHPIVKGSHGYNPTNDPLMTTIAFYTGPVFKKNVTVGLVDQTDHYNLFCHILGLEPLPNNGSWERVKDLLA